MISLSNSGAYLLKGTELVFDDGQASAALKSKTGKDITKEEAKA